MGSLKARAETDGFLIVYVAIKFAYDSRMKLLISVYSRSRVPVGELDQFAWLLKHKPMVGNLTW